MIDRMPAGSWAAWSQDEYTIRLSSLSRCLGGGVPVGLEVAMRVESTVEFDVFLVRKLGVPDREELAFGAIATGGVRVLNRVIIEEMDLSSEVIEQVAQREQLELERREHVYREGRPAIALRNQVVVLVDDGLATGATMIAAVRAARLQQPQRIVVAVPIASHSASCADDARRGRRGDLREKAGTVLRGRILVPGFRPGHR